MNAVCARNVAFWCANWENGLSAHEMRPFGARTGELGRRRGDLSLT